MNTRNKVHKAQSGSGPGTGQKRDYARTDRGTGQGGFYLELEIMRLVKSNESDMGSKTKRTNRLTFKQNECKTK